MHGRAKVGNKIVEAN